MDDRFKFRAWDTRDVEWRSDFTIDPESGEICDQYGCSAGSRNSFIIMQSTGLRDKNVELIYEGDILKMTPLNKNEYLPLQTVYYNVERTGFGAKSKENDNALYTAMTHAKDWEIIGNIYENPELLK